MDVYLEVIAPGWAGLGLSVLFKSVVLLAVACMATLALRQASAAVRHWVWTLGFVCLLALPFVSTALPSWSIPISNPLVATATAENSPPPTQSRYAEIRDPGIRPSELSENSYSPAQLNASAAAPWSWKKSAFNVWLVVFTVLAARLLVGIVASRYLVKRASKVSDRKWVRMLDELSRHLGLSRYVQLLQTERSMVPITCGIFRPRVLLPAESGEWSEERRQSVLLHELGHVRRNDCLTQCLTQLVCALYWWNPLVWFASRQLRQESERACDDLVLDAGTRASDYAHDLLDMARALNVTRRSPLASVTLAHRSRFEDRLLSILDPKAARHTLSRMRAFVSVVVAGALLLLIAVLKPSARAQESPASSTLRSEREISTDSEPQTRDRDALEGEPRPSMDDTDADTVQQERTLIALVEALGDPEPSVREQAIRILGRVRYTPAVPSLIEALEDEDSQVRESAAWALGMTRNPGSAPPLTEALVDPEPNVREQVAWALGMLRDSRATTALAATLQDEEADVREQAAWALGMIQGSEAVPPLIEFLKDSDPDVREQAAWALGMIRDERATSALAVTLGDEEADAREQAAWALGMIRASDVVAPLIESLKDPEPDVREQAAWALGMIQDESAADALLAAMKDEDLDVREQAAWALGMIISRHSPDI